MPDPYAGDESTFPRTISVPNGADVPSSALFKLGFEGLGDRTANLLATLEASAAANWPTAAAPVSGGQGSGCYCWDPYAQRWLAGVDLSGSSFVYATHDGGRTWVNIAGLSGAPNACACMADGRSFWMVAPSALVVLVKKDNSLVTTTMPTSGFTSAMLDAFLIGDAGSPSLVVMYGVVQSGGSFVGHLHIFDGLGATGWADISSALPPTFASGTNHVGQILVANSTGGMRLAAAGDVEAVAICGQTAGTDAAGLMTITSTGPSTPSIVTDVSVNMPSIGVPYIVAGLAYSVESQLWGLLIATASSGSMLFVSTTLSSWTLAHTFSAYNAGQIGGLGVLGRVWCVWVGVNGSLGTDSTGRLLYSTNVAALAGASTWASASTSFALGSSPRIVSSNAQLLMGNATDVQISAQLGTSPAGAY